MATRPGILFALLAAALALPAQAQPQSGLEAVRTLAAAGAADLALARVELAQPPVASDPRWADWEVLRVQLLAERGRHAEVLSRVRAHADAIRDPGQRAAVLGFAARAAGAMGRHREGRAFLRQSFLVADVPPETYRAARRIVIDTYLGEGLVDAAYLAMLRFRQDFAPLQPAEAEAFASALIAAGRLDEAAGWLAQLDPGSPSAALLRLRAGLLAPAAALKQARALVEKDSSPAAWALLAAAGEALSDPEVAIEVHERRLNARADPKDRLAVEAAGALWKSYAEIGQRAANEALLLAGDDAAWLQTAERLQAKRPRTARALLGTLVLQAKSAATRARAQLALLASLRESGLPRTAWRLFSDTGRFPIPELDSQLRFELGALAAEIGEAAAGVRYWEGLPPMEGMSAQQWQARNLALLLQSGMVGEAARLAAVALDSESKLDPESIRRLMAAAADALDFGHTEAVRTVLQALSAHVGEGDRAALLALLGRAYESGGDHRAAAEAYLIAAASAKNPEEDRASLEARMAAASNLVRAGLHADARAVYAWIAAHAKLPEVRQAATRKLASL